MELCWSHLGMMALSRCGHMLRTPPAVLQWHYLWRGHMTITKAPLLLARPPPLPHRTLMPPSSSWGPRLSPALRGYLREGLEVTELYNSREGEVGGEEAASPRGFGLPAASSLWDWWLRWEVWEARVTLR